MSFPRALREGNTHFFRFCCRWQELILTVFYGVNTTHNIKHDAVNYFFLLVSRKCVFSGRCAIRKNAFSRHWARKIMFCPWPQIKDVPNRSLPSSATPRTVIYMRFGSFFTFVAMGKNILFLDSGQKARISWPLRVRQRHVFSPQPQKNRIRPSAIKKEGPKSQFTILGFASKGNLRVILYFSGHGS